MALEKPSLEPRKSLGEDGLQRGTDALGSADREDEEEDEEEEEQTDPKKPTTDEVSPGGGKRQREPGLRTQAFAEPLSGHGPVLALLFWSPWWGGCVEGGEGVLGKQAWEQVKLCSRLGWGEAS